MKGVCRPAWCQGALAVSGNSFFGGSQRGEERGLEGQLTEAFDVFPKTKKMIEKIREEGERGGAHLDLFSSCLAFFGGQKCEEMKTEREKGTTPSFLLLLFIKPKTDPASGQAALPAGLKHIIKRRKRNQQGSPQ